MADFKFVDFLGYPEFAGVKATLLNSNGNEEWKNDFLEFLNEETDEDGKEYFFYMMPCIRFIVDKDSIAYTTPNKAICLSAPNAHINTTMNNWYFIYLHECLHQLWDTFAVEDEVRKQLGDCDGTLMNIASDCVINEFLNNNKSFRLKFPSDDLITAKFLKKKYDVVYDFQKDTQMSLYMKLLEKQDKIKKNPPQRQDPQKQSDEYVKGWNQAIKDFNEGRLKI